MKILKIISIIIVFLSVTLCAQDNDLKNNPGYFDFGELSSYDQGEEGTEIYIQEHLLKMAAKLTKKEDPQLENLLNGLKLVKVNTFEIKKENLKQIKDKLNSIQTSLQRRNWDKIVRIRENGKDMSVYIKTDGSQKIHGLVVAGIENSGKAIFLNIVGDIDLEAIGKLGDKFDIPTLDDINGKQNWGAK